MKYKELVKAVNEILGQYSMPLTLRQIYYRLVSRNLIPNTRSSYKGLSAQLVTARETKDVDDSRIEDRSRKVQGYGDYGYVTIEGFIENAIDHMKRSWTGYTRRLWTSQSKRIFVALEKDALSRLFVNAADDFRVQVYATRGYGSYTFVNDMAEDLDLIPENQEINILYFGDYDPSGIDIERDLTVRLLKYCENERAFKIKRVALTADQIQKYNLPPMPEDAETLEKLKRDPRSKNYGKQFAVELDAIDPDELTRIIQAAIQDLIDMDKWNEGIQKIKDDKAKLKEKMEHVKVFIDGEEYQ